MYIFPAISDFFHFCMILMIKSWISSKILMLWKKKVFFRFSTLKCIKNYHKKQRNTTFIKFCYLVYPSGKVGGQIVFTTGAVLITITGKIPTKELCQPWAQYWLSAGCIQHPNTGYQPTWKSRRQLAFYWFTNALVLIIIITGKLPTYYFHNLSLIYFWHIHSKCIFINNFIINFRWMFHA